MCGNVLFQAELLAGFVEEVLAVRTAGHPLDDRRRDAVGDDASSRRQHFTHLGHNLLHPATVAANEHSVGSRQVVDVGFQEVTDMHVDSGCTKTATVMAHQLFALRPYLKSHHLQMWEEQTCFDGHAAKRRCKPTTKIISDLLELVKMDNSAEKLNIQMVAINDWLKDILHRLAPIAKKQNVDMVMESFRDVTAGIDPSKLSLAVSNLVENAVKYNVDKGYVHVSLNADHKDFFIKVEDNGVGIPESDLDKIFDRFYRADSSRGTSSGGSGLGLAIAKALTEAHGGSITAESREEKIRFTLTLPNCHKNV